MLEKADTCYSRISLISAFSGGFDCILVKTDVKNRKRNKVVDVNELLTSGVGAKPRTPAFIYDIHIGQLAGDVVLSLETGHVMSVQGKNTGQVRWIIDAHWAKIYHR